MKPFNKHSRSRRPIAFLVLAMMLLNMALSITASAQNAGGLGSGLTLMCTSNGWIQVSLLTGKPVQSSTELSKGTELTVPDMASTVHCPYCQAFEFSPNLPELDLVNPSPIPAPTAQLPEQQIILSQRTVPRPNPHRGPPTTSI